MEYDAETDIYNSWRLGISCKQEDHERNKIRSAIVLGLLVLAILCGAMGCAAENDPTRVQIARIQ